MKRKPRPQDQFQLISETDMPFNLAGEKLPAEPPPPTNNTGFSWLQDALMKPTPTPKKP